jgi:MFS family permease
MFRSSLREYASILSSNANIPFLYITTAFISFGQGIIGPVLPLYAREFGVGAAMIGVVVGAFGIARLIVNLPAGLVSERHGRRLLLVGGPIISFISSVLMGIAGSYPELVAYRFMYGVGSAMYMTGAMTFIADVTTRENRASAIFRPLRLMRF